MEKMDSINLCKTDEADAEAEAEAEEGMISDENGKEKGNLNSVDSVNILNSDIHAGNEGGGAEDINSAVSGIIDDSVKENSNLLGVIKPHSLLPQPEVPAGVAIIVSPGEMNRSQSMPESFDMPAIGKFFREKSNSLSSAITKRLSSMRDQFDDEKVVIKSESQQVTEFDLSGMKVIVNLKPPVKKLPGRVSFFSRSNCRDCTAVRSFLHKENLNYVEINVDVYPKREKELIERTGSANVPQIFLNDKLLGGLVALNSLRNSGMLEKKFAEMLAGKCPEDAPAPPVYGFDDDYEEQNDEMVDIVRVLRQKLPIQDRIMRMKIVKNCFSGGELVEVLIHHLDCGRKKAVEIGKNLARRHFIHQVFGENEFEDGKHFYRFLEHEPFVPKCYNFRGSTNDNEPKDVAVLGQRLGKIMSALLESYASDDRHHIDYIGISNSEEFRRYTNLIQDLHRVNLLNLSADEKLAFFLNLYNAMAIHAVIRIGHPGGMIDRRAFFSEFQYMVGGYSYSLSGLKDGILRSNRRAPFTLMRPFPSGDRRLEMAFQKVNPLIHFGLCNATRSSPAVRFFTPQNVESELRYAAREYFQRDDAMQVDLSKRTVYLNRMIKWYNTDFGQEKEILKWITGYLDATKAGLLTHLMGDCGPVNVVYSSFDWSPNA
uniref:DEP domain-containing protein n=1 Tax=Solanum lycopersicum TaxID=4081 RepID=A0A3Q7E9P2_SOLLC